MQASEVKATNYWFKSFGVEAIRLTEDNMQVLAETIGGEHCVKSEEEPFISYGNDAGYAGEWLVKRGDSFFFIGDDEFLKSYQTHSERESEDEKYARVFQLVISAMNKQSSATYNGDQNGMDLVAIETVKKILREL